MPISASAKKSLRVSQRNHKANVSFKTDLKKSIKDYLASPTSDALKAVFSLLDKAVKKNIFHANKTARLKSNYSKLVGTEGVKAGATKKVTKKKIVSKKILKKSANKMK